MGATSGFALKFLQWFNRGVQFLCSAVILGIFAYFLAALDNHNLSISNQVRAVTGISGLGALYSLIGLLLLCCLAGLTFFSFVAIILDVAFIAAFIYVAVANKDGAGSCTGYVDTPFGKGQSSADVSGDSGFTALPSFHTACRLQTACLAVSIIAIFFFIFSILTEIFLARHHRKEKRFGPSPQNDYTSGYGSKGGFFSRLFKGRKNTEAYNENTLPEHTHPEQLDRPSYATETTAVNNNETYHGTYGNNQYKYELADTGYNSQYGSRPTTATQPQNYRYDDGVYDRV